jgi:hypothetical protein
MNYLIISLYLIVFQSELIPDSCIKCRKAIKINNEIILNLKEEQKISYCYSEYFMKRNKDGTIVKSFKPNKTIEELLNITGINVDTSSPCYDLDFEFFKKVQSWLETNCTKDKFLSRQIRLTEEEYINIINQIDFDN